MAFDLFGGGSSASSTDTRGAASESGTVTQGLQSPIAKDQAIQASGVLSKVLANAVDIGAGAQVNTGIQVKDAKGNVTFTSSDPELLKEALAAVDKLTTQFSGTVQDLVGSANSAAATRDEAVLSKLSELAESKQTAGESKRDNTILWIIGVIVSGIVIWALND